MVLSLEGLEAEGQMRCAAAFLSALFDAPRDHWYPALVVVDEAQLFAPSGGGEVAEEVRRASLGAMTNLMCRGRKRGLAGIIATQRLAKLAKNVAAEASNFLMGRTFLDIDMARAADLLGMERRQAEPIRDLKCGTFLALGPAIARRPVTIAIGPVETHARSVSPKLMPLPEPLRKTCRACCLRRTPNLAAPAPLTAGPGALPSEALLESMAASTHPRRTDPRQEPTKPRPSSPPSLEPSPPIPTATSRLGLAAVSGFRRPLPHGRPAAPPLDLPAFTRRLSMARAGIFDEGDAGRRRWRRRALPDDMLGPFLLIARAAREGTPCPTDEAIAASYGTASLGRARRLLTTSKAATLSSAAPICRAAVIAIPKLGWTTAAA